MGKVQCALKQLLSAENMLSERTLRVPRADDVDRSHFSDEVQDVYRQLGGIRPAFPLNLGCWDMEFEGIAIELDERLHLNRYRAITSASLNCMYKHSLCTIDPWPIPETPTAAVFTMRRTLWRETFPA